MDERVRALEQIAAVARAHGLTAAEVAAAIEPSSAAAAARPGQGVLVHVLGVLGGTFVFAGVGVFIALQWSELNSAARVLVTLGAGLTAFVLAVLGTRDPRFDKAATPLFLAAAVLEPGGMIVAVRRVRIGRRLAVGQPRHVRRDGRAVRADIRGAPAVGAALSRDPVRYDVLLDGARPAGCWTAR